MTWGLRSDIAIATRFTFMSELSGNAAERPEFQVGIRTALVGDRLGLDVSWGGHTARGARGAGWTVGAAWTPRPLI